MIGKLKGGGLEPLGEHHRYTFCALLKQATSIHLAPGPNSRIVEYGGLGDGHNYILGQPQGRQRNLPHLTHRAHLILDDNVKRG